MILLLIKRFWEHQFLRYATVGFFGLVIGFLIYNVIYFFNPDNKYRATSSWIVAYLLGVLRQHALHFHLTFKSSNQNYFSSLFSAYGAYSVGLIFSTIINYISITTFSLHHQLVWVISVSSSVAINYILLRDKVFQVHNNDS